MDQPQDSIQTELAPVAEAAPISNGAPVINNELVIGDAPVTKKKKIPPAAKFLVLLAAVVGIGLLLQLARPRSAPRHDDENDFEVKVEAEHETGPALGTKLPLPDENWAANGQTLVIVMSVGCDFCEAMAPFYKELTDKLIGRKNLHIVALLPQAVEESKPFLADQGLNISDVKQVTLKSISVTGTPTVLLVDKTGVVTNIWVGTLSERQKDGLTAALAVNRTK